MNQTMEITGNLPEMQYLTPPPSFNQNLLLDKPPGDLHAYFSMGGAAPQCSTGSHYQCTSGSPRRKGLWEPCLKLWCSLFDAAVLTLSLINPENKPSLTYKTDIYPQLTLPISLSLSLKHTIPQPQLLLPRRWEWGTHKDEGGSQGYCCV